MKPLTYGTLPSFFDFKFSFACLVKTERYDVELGATDARMFEETGLPSGTLNTNGKYAYSYDVEQLYALCEALVSANDGFNGGESEEEAEWAGDFCSHILTTLGFEWI